MRQYDYNPRPNIESHFHIQELIEAQEKRAADRSYHQDRAKRQEERIKDIKDAPSKETKPFYCETCKEDFLSEAVKQVEIDWANTSQSIAFYKTKCFKGHWCIRHITDKLKDGYWQKSFRVAKDRSAHHTDLLQSFESGYQLMYGHK